MQPVKVIRESTLETLFECGTIAEAENHIAAIEQTDPVGVHAGDYGIDAPEELVNPSARRS